MKTKMEKKDIQRNPDRLAKKLIPFISHNLDSILLEAKKEYLAKGKLKDREKDFDNAVAEAAVFNDMSSYLENFYKFIGTGSWEKNSANTRLLIAAIRCYMAKNDEYQDVSNDDLRDHVLVPLRKGLNEYIESATEIKKAAEQKASAARKELEKKKEITSSQVPDVMVFWDTAKKTDEVLIKAREYQLKNPLHHIFLIKPDPTWQLFWMDLQGSLNFLPITKDFSDILNSLKGKVPERGDAYNKINMCCKQSLDDSINIYLFKEQGEAKEFASKHPDKHSFCLKRLAQATPAKNYTLGIQSADLKPEYRCLYLKKAENDTIHYTVSRKNSECCLILQSSRPTPEDSAYENLNFAYILTADNRLFYLQRQQDGRLEIKRLEFIKNGLERLKSELVIKGNALERINLEPKEKSRVLLDELRRSEKDILESVTNFIPEVPMMKAVITRKDFNSDSNWELLCTALEQDNLPEDPQKEILNNLLEFTAVKKRHTVLIPAKWQLSSYDNQGHASYRALTNEMLREITGPRVAEIPPMNTSKFYHLKMAVNRLVQEQLEKINLQINPDLTDTKNLSTTYVFHNGIPLYLFPDEASVTEQFLQRLHTACIITGSGKLLYHRRGESLQEYPAASTLIESLNPGASSTFKKGLLIAKLSSNQLQTIGNIIGKKLTSEAAIDWYDTLALEPHSVPLAQHPLLEDCLKKESDSSASDPQKIKVFLQAVKIRRLVEASKSKTVQSILENQIRNLRHSPEALKGVVSSTVESAVVDSKADKSRKVANAAKTSSCKLMDQFIGEENSIYTEFPICSFVLSKTDWKLFYFDTFNRCFPVDWSTYPDIKEIIESWQTSDHVVTKEEQDNFELLLAKVSVKKALKREDYLEVEKWFLNKSKQAGTSAEIKQEAAVPDEVSQNDEAATLARPPSLPKKLDPARVSKINFGLFKKEQAASSEISEQSLEPNEVITVSIESSKSDEAIKLAPPPPPPPPPEKLKPARVSQFNFLLSKGEKAPGSEDENADNNSKIERTC
ncbi:hypothetical protein B1207_10595 [Legionella quinlivanii]|uniref:Uncharacterized protein n=1 Tax=Legionella quinlivanii TaxID=45073 RepID=A0A364LI23_9GAMM|nr:hypothetical protein [Legionella quinlivanii]RAP36012.1 hypothetical protein B1207_10595 [Legionella quinlivanii]